MKQILCVLTAAIIVSSALLAANPEHKCPPDMWMTFSLTFPAKAASADLHIYDPLHRHLGMDYETMVIDEDIPDGTLYTDPGGNQEATLETLESGTYEVQLVGIDVGCYTLTIRGYENNTLVYEEVYEDCIIIEEVQSGDVDVDADGESLDVDTEEPRPIPVGLMTAVGCNSIRLTWDETRGAASYKVYYDNDAPGPEYEGSEANEGPSPIDVAGTTEILLTGLTSEVVHYLVATAVDSYGVESNYSAEVEAVPIPLDVYTKPSLLAFSPEFPHPEDPFLCIAYVCCALQSNPADSVRIQFFDGDPQGAGVQIGVDQTSYDLVPGECNTVEMPLLFTDPVPHAIYARLDPQDDLWECDETNNGAFKILKPTVPAAVDILEFPGPSCKAPGPSVSINPIYCYIELPVEYDLDDLDDRSLLLSGANGSIRPRVFSGIPWEIGDYDADGIPDLMVTFHKAHVEALPSPDSSLLTLTGEVNWRGGELCPPVLDVPFLGGCTLEDGDKGVDSPRSPLAGDVFLHADYTRPTPRGISILYGVAEYSSVSLKIYDAAGRIVTTVGAGEVEPGSHTIIWDGKDSLDRDVRGGIYFCELSGETRGNHRFREVEKVILLR